MFVFLPHMQVQMMGARLTLLGAWLQTGFVYAA